MRVGIAEAGAPERDGLEAFIRADFARVYGADVHHFLPRLMSLQDEGGQLLAALGFRPAESGSLFLEYYLDAPIEAALADAGQRAPRAHIVEVGNLAVGHAGGARWLIAALTAYLAGARYRWAVFTAVPSIVNSFTRMGIQLIRLAPAERSRLPIDEQPRWGRYYDTGPTVVAASVRQSFDALTAYLDLPRDRYRLAPLWLRAYAAGLGVA